jgi:hypothetical protein
MYLAVWLKGQHEITIALVVLHQGRDTADGGGIRPCQIEDHFVVESTVAVPKARVGTSDRYKRLDQITMHSKRVVSVVTTPTLYSQRIHDWKWTSAASKNSLLSVCSNQITTTH